MFSFEPNIAIWSIFAFLLAFSVIWFKVYPAIKQILAEREAAISHDLDSATQEREQAEHLKCELEEQLKKGVAEREKLLAETKAELTALREEKLTELHRELNSEQKLAEERLRAMELKFKEDHAQDIKKLIIASCEKFLKEELSAEQQQLLIEQSLEQLAGINNA